MTMFQLSILILGLSSLTCFSMALGSPTPEMRQRGLILGACGVVLILLLAAGKALTTP